MKPILGAVLLPLACLLGVLIVPLAGSGGTPMPTTGSSQCFDGSLQPILATIRALESGGNYQAHAANSTASGAYQFINDTWGHWSSIAGYDGLYPTAGDAPPAVQDNTAAAMLTDILGRWNGDIAMVPIEWYIGPGGAARPDTWDTVPAGNRLTPRQYQAKWLAIYDQQAALANATTTTSTEAAPTITPDATVSPAAGSTFPVTTPAVDPPGGPTTVVPGFGCGPADATVDGFALPVPRDAVDKIGGLNHLARNPHHDYPAIDIMVPEGTAVYAMRAGTVISVHTNPHNCVRSCTSTCGTGLTITDSSGYHWTYCHGTGGTLTVADGDSIQAGQHLFNSGDTGRSGAPHLHIEIRRPPYRAGSPGQDQLCPQPLLATIYTSGVGLDPATLPNRGCSF